MVYRDNIYFYDPIAAISIPNFLLKKKCFDTAV